MNKVRLHINYAGYCLAKESHSIKGGKNKDIRFQAMFGLIQHPKYGWILYDTGYTRRFFDATNKYPNKIYAKMTKVVIKEEDEVVKKLSHFNLTPADIKHVIISHFHADHIGGLKDFKNATFYVSKEAYKQYQKTSSFFGFTKGILKDLVPIDFEQRLVFIEEFASQSADDIFNFKYDLFKDQSILVYALPGHAAGQIGLQLNTEKNKYFLVSDACWNIRAITELSLPSSIVRLFFDSWKSYKSSIRKLNSYHKKYPEVIIVPTHCSLTTSKLVSNKFDMDEL
jgi:glyoxylase-like metal-dependent hydrolase (beta-lactamase superfamily II)